MKLIRFHVKNYRSINDSGPIEVTQQTGLVGRNESGKSNLLLALKSLKTPEGMSKISFAKDFPRDRHRDEFSEDLDMLETLWDLSEAEQEKLAKIFPRAKTVSQVTIGRTYEPSRWVRFEGLSNIRPLTNETQEHVESLSRSVSKQKVDGKEALQPLLERLKEANHTESDPSKWANAILSLVTELRNQAKLQDLTFTDLANSALDDIEVLASTISKDEEAHQAARNWITEQLPVFVYLDDYPYIEGHQDIPAFLTREREGQLTEEDRYFQKLMKVAGLDAGELDQLLQDDHETRHQLTNRASAVVTKKLRELWKDRSLTVRFNPDGNHFDTLIADPNTLFDVEINLNERSRGLQWFFSFYITFEADTQGGPAEKAILLLDEPGLHLHALGQRDLLDHFANDFENQIIYTTHSPFMVPTNNIGSIRTVNIAQEKGTHVHNSPMGDSKTVFPILHALGVEITQSLFIGEWNLVVEGVTDFWYLSTISDYLRESGGAGLAEELTITPAGSSSKVAYMVSLLTGHKLKTIVLLDEESRARDIARELVKSKLIRETNVVFASSGLDTPPDGGADIEDLLEPAVFATLVQETYADEIAGKTLNINEQIPRIVKRYERAFAELGIEFQKTRPSRLFLRKMADSPEEVLTPETRQRFERLFDAINKTLSGLQRREDPPFN